MSILPIEMFAEVAKYLSFKDTASLGITCQNANSAASRKLQGLDQVFDMYSQSANVFTAVRTHRNAAVLAEFAVSGSKDLLYYRVDLERWIKYRINEADFLASFN